MRRHVVAKTGDEIFNPRTGQRMIFLETGAESDGGLLRNESYIPPAGDAEPEHVHPFQESGAEVISGSVRFRVSGEERSLKAGESITIPADTPHFFWNDGEEDAHFIGWFRPALKIERFFEAFFGLAQDGKLNEKGLPSMLQLAVMVPHFGDEIRLTSPPWAVQKATFGALAPIGRLLGYRPEYPYPYGGGRDEPSASEGARVSTNAGAGRGAIALMVIVAALLSVALLLWRRRRGEVGDKKFL
jgi:mannose-6-phosphate isomerase-like protein (cupin superfamily)